MFLLVQVQYTWISCRILLKNVTLPVTWGDRTAVNGVRRTGSSFLHHCRHHHKRNVTKLTEGIVIEIGMWTEGTPERGTWIVGIGTNSPRDQTAVTVGLPETREHPGILPETTS
jgi:hypothetical protein